MPLRNYFFLFHFSCAYSNIIKDQGRYMNYPEVETARFLLLEGFFLLKSLNKFMIPHNIFAQFCAVRKVINTKLATTCLIWKQSCVSGWILSGSDLRDNTGYKSGSDLREKKGSRFDLRERSDPDQTRENLDLDPNPAYFLPKKIAFGFFQN